MADYGLKISKPGVNVVTGDDKDMVYTSKYRGMKINSHNVKAAAGSVAHGISGYIPMAINFYLSGGKYRLDNYVFRNQFYIDSTNVNFPSTDNYYFIFIDKGD